MRWELLDLSDPTNMDKRNSGGYEFFWVRDSLPAFLLEKDESTHVLIAPPSNHTMVPVGIFSYEELKISDTWRILLHETPPHKSELAVYSRRFEDIPPEVFLDALDIRPTYKTVADWKELGSFSGKTLKLARSYDFSVAILRLFDRLPEKEANAWTTLWKERNLKKNFIRDIIEDFYDLNEPLRKESLQNAIAFSSSWLEGKTAFPGHVLRDIVRRKRHPVLESHLEKLQNIKNNLKTPRSLRLEIPSDLESESLKIELEIRNEKDIRDLTEFFARPSTTEQIQQLLNLLK